MPTLGERLREQRLLKDMTLKDVADRIGVTEATVQRYESGNIHSPKHKITVRLSELFGCEPAYLMGWTNNSLNDINIEANPDTQQVLDLYSRLDTEDKAEIRGEMKQMLKAPKYNEKVTPKPQVHVPNAIGKIAAFGSGPADIEIDEESKKKLAQLARKKQK